MGIITLPNFRTTADVTAMVRLKDGGLAIDWSEAAGIKAWLYSDAQKAISGRFDVSVNQEDHTLLKCDYSATKPQYLGVNRIIVQATFRGRTKTYDKAAFNFVPRTSDVPGDITIEDPVVDLEIEVSDVSSSILDEVIYAAIAATEKANEAAEQIPLQVLTDAREATAEALDAAEEARAAGIDDVEADADNNVGTPSVDATLENKKLTLHFHNIKGLTGNTPHITIGVISTLPEGSQATVTLRGTADDPIMDIGIPVGATGPQGNTGSSVDYPFELSNNLTTDDPTKGLSAAQGVALNRSISQLRIEGVDGLNLSLGEVVNIYAAIPASGSHDTGFPVKSGKSYKMLIADKSTITGDIYVATSFNDSPLDSIALSNSQWKTFTPARDGTIRVYNPNNTTGTPIIKIIENNTWSAQLIKDVSSVECLTRNLILEYEQLILGTTYFDVSLVPGISYTITNFGTSTIVVYTTSEKSNDSSYIIESVGTIAAGGNTIFIPSSESHILRVYSNGANGKIRIENPDYSNKALKERIDGLQDAADASFVKSEQYVTWGNKNSLIRPDGTNYNGIGNAKITSQIPIPNTVKKVYIENIFVQTGAYTSTCAIVAFASDNSVLGYSIFAKKDERYNLEYELPENTAYIRMSSGGYPTIDDAYPTLYFLVPSNYYNKLVEDTYKEAPLSKSVENMMAQITRLPRVSNSAQANSLWILSYMSDIHYDLTNLKRYIAFNEKYKDVLDGRLCGGDMVNSYWSAQGYSFAEWLATPGAGDIMLTVGNHDTAETGYHYAGEEGGALATDVYSRIFSPLITGWNVVQPENAAANGLMYYYKDYASKGIRLIVLDCMYWDADENTWFRSVLEDARTNGRSVIVCAHYMPGAITPFACKAFNTLQASYSQQTTNSAAAQDVQDFIDNGGAFVCWLAGHTHKDYAGVLTDYPEQICLVISCDSCATDQCAYCDSERARGTVSQDAIDVIAVDTFHKVIRVLRVGDNLDSWLRSRSTMAINYELRVLINAE